MNSYRRFSSNSRWVRVANLCLNICSFLKVERVWYTNSKFVLVLFALAELRWCSVGLRRFLHVPIVVDDLYATLYLRTCTICYEFI